MVKKKWKITSLTSLVVFLASCGIFSGSDSNQPSGQEGANDGSPVVEETVDADFYRPILTEDGTYPTSENRGITLQLNSNINIELFEQDLMRLSQDHFSTEDHYFQEGQYLPSDLVSTWLERRSEDNPEGLNPPSNDSTDPEEREPNYLSSILEQDYYVQNEDGEYELAGISIGLAMNSVDYYPAYQYGPTLEQEIPRDELLQAGENVANEVVSRMRGMEEIGDVPIMVGIFEQAPSDDLAGGVYLQKGTSEGGSDSVSNWESLNEERIIFPLEGTDTQEGNMFMNFQSVVEQFFPNLSGVIGRAHYVNDLLVNLEVEITTQFYGQGEMIAFTQFLNTTANNYLPENIEIDIVVESLNGIESVLKREANEDSFITQVF